MGKGKPTKHDKKADRHAKKMHKRRRDRILYGGTQWHADFKRLSDQLLLLGLTIKDVAGDGNCLFRSIADQLEDNPNKHGEYRHAIVTYIAANREMFEPFLDTEEEGTFEQYIANMSAPTAWGGHMELQAASLLFKINAVIYQLDQPRWEIVNFKEAGTKTIHLSYHDGDHYASVRAISGMSLLNVSPTAVSQIVPVETPPLPAVVEDDSPPNALEQIIMDNSGCYDVMVVRRTLMEKDWDSDATIAVLSAQYSDQSHDLEAAIAATTPIQNQQVQQSPVVHTNVNIPAQYECVASSAAAVAANSHHHHLHQKVSKFKEHLHNKKKGRKGRQQEDEKVTKDMGSLTI
eukprot:TRINITY_DN6870_c0_g1_i1.p1 TRINITY_DN6870_c0_g1~~TRINITY_DN6870_c0_g1_i1.p1  ORF type:complete len:347 (+),score=101.47 TRINITY_DN6870_c0_g1_i1:42-1082(+)